MLFLSCDWTVSPAIDRERRLSEAASAVLCLRISVSTCRSSPSDPRAHWGMMLTSKKP